MMSQNAKRATTLFENIQQLLPEHLQTVEHLVDRLLKAQPVRSAQRSQGHQMSMVLSQLAKLGGTDIADPAAWQREVRRERDLFDGSC
ncbi:MAG: hypothetical protein ACPGVO_08305 [Spirulinaceae cyanobacterium]